MRGCTRTAIALITCAVLSTASITAARAASDISDRPVAILGNANAPVAITRCKFQYLGTYGQSFVNVVNRTTHGLLSVAVDARFYDADGVQIGQSIARHAFDDQNGPVASGDTASLAMGFGTNLSEPDSAITRATCRVTEASFTGQKHWTNAQTWPEKIMPLAPPPRSYDPQGATGNIPPPFAAAMQQQQNVRSPKFGITVANAWNDALNGNTFVHVALSVQGASTDANLSADMLSLTMRLANGALKTYAGYTAPAPTYQKLNPLGSQTATAYEVDPKVDLGALGPIIVPANGTVSVVVTFLVQDVLANPADNRQVGLR